MCTCVCSPLMLSHERGVALHTMSLPCSYATTTVIVQYMYTMHLFPQENVLLCAWLFYTDCCFINANNENDCFAVCA